MTDSEGIKEAVQVSLKMMDMLEALFGVTFHTTEKMVGFMGKGIGKIACYLWNLKKTKRMLDGGEKKFREIVQNRGSLDMSVMDVNIEEWDSKEGRQLREYLDNRGVQYVLLDDMTKGDNKVQFMFHALDADRVNRLLTEYGKVKFNDAKSMAEAYDDLPHDTKQEMNASFEREITALDYKSLGISGEPVWSKAEYSEPEKKSEFTSPANIKKQIYRDVVIPETNVKKDLAREIAFIRCGSNGYIVPLECIREEMNGESPGKTEVKVRCRIDVQGQYLKFQDGIKKQVSGKELAEDLDNIKTSLWKPERGYSKRKGINQELPLKTNKK